MINYDNVRFPNSNDGINVQDSLKLIGITIDSKLTFNKLVKERSEAARKATWMIVKLKNAGLEEKMVAELFEIYLDRTGVWRRFDSVKTSRSK